VSAAVFAVAFCVFGGIAALTWWFSDAQKIKRALRRAEHVDVAEYPHGGYKRIRGELRYVGRPLQAPLSGRACAAWQVVVEEYRGTAKHGRWVEVIRETKAVPFTLSDVTGTAFVDPQGGTVVITVDRESKTGLLDDPAAAEQRFMQRHGRDSDGLLLDKPLRYTEGILEEGEDVAVLGHGARSHHESVPASLHQGGYRTQALGQRLEIRAPRELPFVISDDLEVVRQRRPRVP